MKNIQGILRFLTASLLCSSVALAANASFTVNSGATNTTAQSLGAGQTGTVNSGGTLAVTGNNVAISVTGNATITNNGTIEQMSVLTAASGNAGKSRAIRDNTGGLTLTVTNGSSTNSTALIQTQDADVIQMNVAGSTVTFYNYGTLNSLNSSGGGNQAIDWNALNTTTGSNTLYNYSTGVITATEADAVRPGVNGVIYNYGTIKSTTTTGSSSDGVDAQNNTGVTVTNYATGLIEGGRHGITGGAKDNTVNFTTTITNNAGGTIKGDNGSGINLDGFNAKQTATIVNAGTIIGNGVTGDGDGVDVDGVINLTNTGTIRSINAYSATTAGLAYSEGVTVGGGTITNSGLIEGDVAAGNTNAVGRGISIVGNDSTTIPGAREPIYANATVTNQSGGVIRGQSDSGIYIGDTANGYTVTINNAAGATIEGAGATAATIQAGAVDVTINTAGSIINDGGDSKAAIALGAGNDQVNVTGGSARIVGGIDGGSGSNTLNFNLGAPTNTFTHSGVIANFDKVSVLSGQVTLNGNNTYTGTTTVGDGLANASLSVNGLHSGGGAYTVLSGSTLGGTGTFALANATTKIDIQNGAALHIGGGQLTVATGSLNVAGVFSFDLNSATAGSALGNQLAFSAGNTGTLTLTGTSTLLLNLSFTPVVGQQFELIDLQNSAAHIDGTFAGLTEGSTFYVGSAEFQISYAGGTGNDLVVTAIPEPATTAIFAGVGALACVLLLRRRRSLVA